jgi:broad specificity phosphatase PhoE
VARAWTDMNAFAAGVTGNTVVVTHALVYRVILDRYLDVRALAGDAPLRLPNTAFTSFEPVPPHHVHVLASASHLEGDARPDERAHPAGI